MPAEMHKTKDRTINHAQNTFYFWDDMLIISKGKEIEHANFVKKVMENLDEENLAKKFSKREFIKNEVDWLSHHLSESEFTPKFIKIQAIHNQYPTKSLK